MIADELLTQYLLGSLAGEDAEHLDELSVTDDEIAWRLRALENDLVDNYVRGELSAATLEQFQRAYLASPDRRRKVVLANALRSLEQRYSMAAANAVATQNRWFARPRFTGWAVAASVVAVITTAYLLWLPQRHDDAVRGDSGSAMLRVPQLPPSGTGTATVSFLLVPSKRGVAPIATLSIPAGTDRVTLRLQLDSDDFPAYQGVLRDLVRNEIVWRSEAVPSAPEGTAKSVSLDLSRKMLKQQNYSLELSGVPAREPTEMITSYPFHVQLR